MVRELSQNLLKLKGVREDLPNLININKDLNAALKDKEAQVIQLEFKVCSELTPQLSNTVAQLQQAQSASTILQNEIRSIQETVEDVLVESEAAKRYRDYQEAASSEGVRGEFSQRDCY